eukprot:293667-Prymnesium_polylepis.1
MQYGAPNVKHSRSMEQSWWMGKGKATKAILCAWVAAAVPSLSTCAHAAAQASRHSKPCARICGHAAHRAAPRARARRA